MFKENFIRLCNERGESPSSVCKKVNITPATFSGWDSNSVPRQATLLRIADYFGVTVESLTADTTKAKAPTFNESFTESEKELVVAYRKHPEMHEAVHKILGMEEGEHNMANVFTSYNNFLKEYFKVLLGQELHIKNPENAFGKLDEHLGVNGSVKWFHDVNDNSLDNRVDEILAYVGKTYETIYDGKSFVIESTAVAKVLGIKNDVDSFGGMIISGTEAYKRLSCLSLKEQQELKKAYAEYNKAIALKASAESGNTTDRSDTDIDTNKR